MWVLSFLCLLLCWTVSESRLVLEKGAFLQLPDAASRYIYNAGTASRASYDDRENFLYVVGHKADVMHVIDLSDPQNPELLTTKAFNKVNQGLPNFVKVCRNADGNGFLAVSFESVTRTSKGHVHIYELLTQASVQSSLTFAKDIVTTDSYDPRPFAWTSNCSMLLVASEGGPHESDGRFVDPPADIEVLILGFGTTIQRRTMPMIASTLEDVEVRHVFHDCDGSTGSEQLLQNMEPTAVHIDNNDMAYIVFQENNAIATLDLRSSTTALKYHSLGTKDWSAYALDGSYDDKAINLTSRKIRSFYQPRDMTSFEMNGKVYLATADTGSVRKYSLSSCRFDESVIAYSWRQQFADGLSPDEISKLKSEMASTAQIGRLLVSKQKTTTDGWDPVYQGYDFVTTFGGRGFSILDPTNNMQRVFDSGDDFERYFTTDDASDADKALFNALVGSATATKSSQFDRGSPDRGPLPSAIAAGEWDASTQVVVTANGRVGGLYTYSVRAGSPEPVANFESFVLRGGAGQSWRDAYAQQETDNVGEPYITDLLFIDDQDQKTVVAVSEGAGALSFYSLRDE